MPTQISHRRTHNLLLIKKLLECRDSASPFTLILDSLEQSGKPLLREFLSGANKSKIRTVFASFEALKAPHGVDAFIQASALDFNGLRTEVAKHVHNSDQRSLLVFDALNILLHQPAAAKELPAFLSSFITPTTSVVAVYRLDIPVPHALSDYGPHPLTLLKYLATTILLTHSLGHLIASKEARLRSVAPPVFGLSEEKEGVIVGLGSNDRRGTVVEMEYRRKSGRAVHEVFFIPRRGSSVSGTAHVVLLDDHPDYKAASGQQEVLADRDTDEITEGTFSLNLTDKQRRDREGVVLPYFDAQKEGGVGEGGRILYDMGVEDDFDEEEDEI